MTKASKKPGLLLSSAVLMMVAAVLTVGIISGITTIPLLVVNIFLALVVSMLAGFRYSELEKGMVDGVKKAMDCVIILLFVGILVASWIQCGTVPMIIYYGLGFVTPRMILPFTFLMCSLLSICIGTSLGTAGTMGVACVSIGVSMGIPIELLAGAAISGSILGDKLSPLSDSTILTSGASGTNLYYHVRSMFYTTGPSFLITLVLFYILGGRYAQSAADQSTLEMVRGTLAGLYHFHIVLLLPLLLIVVLSLKKVPAIFAIMLSGFSGMALAMAVQGASPNQLTTVMLSGFSADTGIALVDTMLSKGGISSMMNTICTAVLALGLGGILSEAGYLHTVVERLTKSIHSDRTTVLATLFCGIITVMLVTNFYVSAVLMGTMFKEVYDRQGLHRSVLSRTIEEANTIILPLVPWNTGCIYYMGLFGLSAISFAPYVLFAYVNIVFSILCAVTGFFLFKAIPGNTDEADWSIRRRKKGSPIPALAPEFCADAAALMEESAEALSALIPQQPDSLLES